MAGGPAAVLNILLTANNSQATAALAKTDAQLKGTAASAKATSGALAKYGKVGALAFGVAAAASVKLATDFDKSMRNVNSIAQLSEKQFKSLESSVLELAGKTAQAPKTLAEGLYDLVSSGFDASESMVVLEASATAATAGLTDTATSTKAVAAVLNAYGKPAEQAAKVSDVLFKTVDRGVISFEELASTIGGALPAATNLGVKLPELGAAISTLTRIGQPAAQALTNINAAMTGIFKPTVAMREAIKDLGYENARALIAAEGLQGGLKALVGTTDGTTESVGELFSNVRAQRAVFGLTGQNAKKAAEDVKAFGDASGATQKALSEQSKSLSFQLQKLWANVQAGAIALGLKLVPALADVTKWINQAIRGLQGKGKLADELEEVGNVARIVGNVFTTTLSLALEAVADLAKGVARTFRGVAGVFKGVVKTVGALFRGDWREAWQGMKEIARGAVDTVIGVFESLTSPIRGAIRKLIKGPLKGFANAVGKVGRSVASAFGSMWLVVKGTADAIVKAVDKMVGALGDVKDALPNLSFANPKNLFNSGLPGFGGVPGLSGWQKGGIMVPGTGSGDKIPAMLEPGEVVWNREAVKAFFGGPQKANAANQAVPRFAKGGIAGLANMIARRFGLSISSGMRPGDPGYHGRGLARDIAGGVSEMNRASSFINQSGIWRRLLEGIYSGDPYLSVDMGQKVPPSFWGAGTWAQHANHLHLAMGPGGFGFAKIPKIGIKGRGPLGDVARGTEKRLRRAANAYLRKQLATMGGGDAPGMGGGMSKRALSGLWVRANRGLGNPGLMAAIALAESGGVPTAVGNDPGGTTGLGLWQITTGYNDDIIKAFGGRDAMFNPYKNAQAAGAVFRRQGLSAWNASRSNWGQFMARGGVVGAQRGRVFTLGDLERMRERIAEHTAFAESALSPGGENLTGGEQAQLIRKNERLLDRMRDLRKRAKTGLRQHKRARRSGKMTGKEFKRGAARLREILTTLSGVSGRGGYIFETRGELARLRGYTSVDEQERLGELLDLERQRSAALLRAYNVSQAQYPALSSGFQRGGAVGAPAYNPTTNVNVNVGSGMEWLRQFIQTEVKHEMNRNSRSRSYGRAGAFVGGRR